MGHGAKIKKPRGERGLRMRVGKQTESVASVKSWLRYFLCNFSQ
jgi:hypothetical protein